MSGISMERSDGSGAGHHNPLTSFCSISAYSGCGGTNDKSLGWPQSFSRYAIAVPANRQDTNVLCQHLWVSPGRPNLPRQAGAASIQTTKRIDQEFGENEHSKPFSDVCKSLTISESEAARGLWGRLTRAPGVLTGKLVKGGTVEALPFSLSWQLVPLLHSSIAQVQLPPMNTLERSPASWEENARAVGGFDKNFRSSLAQADR